MTKRKISLTTRSPRSTRRSNGSLSRSQVSKCEICGTHELTRRRSRAVLRPSDLVRTLSSREASFGHRTLRERNRPRDQCTRTWSEDKRYWLVGWRQVHFRRPVLRHLEPGWRGFVGGARQVRWSEGEISTIYCVDGAIGGKR